MEQIQISVSNRSPLAFVLLAEPLLPLPIVGSAEQGSMLDLTFSWFHVSATALLPWSISGSAK